MFCVWLPSVCVILMTKFFLSSSATGGPLLQPFTFRSGINKGQSASVMCAVAEGSRPLTFSWSKDGAPLTDSPQTKIRTTAEEEGYSVLLISSADVTQAGNYTCIVSNEFGTGNFTAQLRVFESPEWLVMPEDTEIILGSSGFLDCMAKGVPDPKVTWNKIDDETSSSLSTKGRHMISNNGSLLFGNTQVTDAGTYECIVTNGVGNGLRKVVNINVRVPPQFRESYSLMKIRSGYSVSLKCEAFGDSPIFIQWSKDYPHFKDPRHRITETPLPNGLLSEVQISQLTRQDTGLYVCFARNAYGQQERTIKLVVLEPPASPSEIFVKEISSYEVTVDWAEPYNGNSPVLQYTVQYWKDSAVPPKLEEGSVRGEQTTFVIKELQPGLSYVVRVIAENQFGASTPSTPVKFTTSEDKPSGYPTDISIFARGSSAINISWKAPPPDQRNGAIQGYEVGYRNRRETTEHFTFIEVPRLSGELQEYVISDLKENTEYELIVRAYNRAGRGPSSVPVVARTREAVKLTTPVLWTESTTSSSILLYWSGNDALSSDNINYTVHYQAEGGSWHMKRVPESNSKNFLLTHLNADTLYHVYVEASSGNDKRSVSATLSARTSGVDMSNLMSSSSMTHAADVSHQTALVISLSVVISSVIIVCIIAGACVYVTRVKMHREDKLDERDLTEHQSRSMSASSPSNFHYVDVNSRPLLWCSTPAPPNDYPSPYATLPLRSTPISKRWNSDEGLSPAESLNTDSLHSQRVDAVEEKSDKIPSCHD